MWIIAEYQDFTKSINCDKFASITMEQTNEGGRMCFEDQKGHIVFYVPIVCERQEFTEVSKAITAALNTNEAIRIQAQYLIN